MQATLQNPTSESLEKLFGAFDHPAKIRQFIERHTDTGGYYAPAVITTETWQHDVRAGELVRQRTLTIAFPNSFMGVGHDAIEIAGRRGSIEDCLAPLLRECGIDLDSPLWRVRTTRPDVPWYKRAAKAVAE